MPSFQRLVLLLALTGCSEETVIRVDESDGDASTPREQDASLVDAPSSPDAATDDAHEDAAPPRCVSDDACSDGVFCNGVERCAEAGGDVRGCMAASSDACLATQRCDEAADRCITDCAAGADADGDGADATDCGGDDCNDADARTFPGNAERCDADAHDEDCDPTTFGFRDTDMDGFPDALCCNRGAEGELNCGTDCDDLVSIVHPTEAESCDTLDNDCDGTVDEDVRGVVYRDADGDDFGDPAHPLEACHAGEGYVPNDADCDDTNPARNPGAPEICDALDNDCNSLFDARGEDDDGDGYADRECGGDDCNDALGESTFAGALFHPGAVDRCELWQGWNDVPSYGTWDYNCDGVVADADRDGYLPVGYFCEEVEGRPFPDERDCDPNDDARSPGQAERCDGIDNDCDERIDEDAAADCSLPGGTNACVAGECVITSCDAHFGACDGDLENGCEDLDTNVDHCGACGHACAFACSEGVCIEALNPAYRGVTSAGTAFQVSTYDHPQASLVPGLTGVIGYTDCTHYLGGHVECDDWAGHHTYEDVAVWRGYGARLHTGGRLCTQRYGDDDWCTETDLVSLRGGSDELCGLTRTGVPRCWIRITGYDDPVEVDLPAGPFTGLGVFGSYWTKRRCAIRASELVCSENEWISAPSIHEEGRWSETTTTVVSLRNATSVSGSDDDLCATTSDGSVYCWVWGGLPVRVPGVTNAREIAVGEEIRFVTTRDGGLMCWGGECGDTPVAIRVE